MLGSMSRTTKEGKRFWRTIPGGKHEAPGVYGAMMDRHTYCSTEKIARRNRRLWERLAAKRRRAVDKRVIQSEQP